MTQAEVTLLVTPISTALIAIAFMMLQWYLPKRPVPVYLVNGTVDRIAHAIKATIGTEQVGLVDAEGYVVIRGERFMLKMEGYEESTINIVRQRGQQ